MSQQLTVSDVIVQRLRDWGVRRLFGYSCDGMDGFVDAMQRAAGGVDFVQARHEEMAAFMAVGHAKYTRQIGVCVATQRSGAVHVLNGLYDAKLDRQPVLAIVGAIQQRDIDLRAVFGDACVRFCEVLDDAQQVPSVLDQAIRTALTTRSPVCLILPQEMQSLPVVNSALTPTTTVGSMGISWPEVVAPMATVQQAAEVLNAGHRIAILLGPGAARAAAEVAQVADFLDASVSYVLAGKGILGDEESCVTGPLGHLGSTASWKVMQSCDTLLLVGVNESSPDFLPPLGTVRAVQIDTDGQSTKYRYPAEVNLIGDAAGTLRALLTFLQQTSRSEWRFFVEQTITDWRNLRIRWAQQSANPLNPQLVFEELSARLPSDAVLAVDVGSTTYWYARHMQMKPSMQSSVSSALGSMGSAMPYGIAAKLAFPDRPVFMLAGDGAMQMHGLGEMITLSRLWHQFVDPRFVMLVLNNGDLNEASWEMRERKGTPRFSQSQDLPPFLYAKYAELLGFVGMRLDAADIVGKVLDEALSLYHPVLVEAVVDPSVPLLAPHLDEMHSRNLLDGLEAEGADGASARELLLQHDEGQLTLP